MKRLVRIIFLCMACLSEFFAQKASAFALLGPYAPWMSPTNNLRLPVDIGGPMNLDEEYRWNVPFVTYGFDQSFLDYFGSNGVAAVESAIAEFNALPPASVLNPSNYPTSIVYYNYAAQSQGLLDLKSQTLSSLIEQMGLAQPVRFVASLKSFSISNNVVTGDVFYRNFDPFSWTNSYTVNGNLFSIQLIRGGNSFGWGESADTLEYDFDPLAPSAPAIADFWLSIGQFYGGLSRDDVGGLRYLLLSSNVNYEPLLPDVHGVNGQEFVNGAWRPGVDKMTFVPHPIGEQPGQFIVFTNQFTDTFVSNGITYHQQLERTVSQPDFLFCAGDTLASNVWIATVVRTDTSGWLKQAQENGDTTKLGPGIIRPPVKIVFNRLGNGIAGVEPSDGDSAIVTSAGWANFDGLPNPPFIYPQSSFQPSNMVVHLRLQLLAPTEPKLFTWQLPVPYGSNAVAKVSSNLFDWKNSPALNNDGRIIVWDFFGTFSPRFFTVDAQ